MASSESQGKTIALVIFVVLTVASSATAYYFFAKVDELEKAKVAAASAKSAADTDLRKAKDDLGKVREILLGAAGGAEDVSKILETAGPKLTNPNTTNPLPGSVPARKASHETFVGAVDYLNNLVASQDKTIKTLSDQKGQLEDRIKALDKIYQAKVDVANKSYADSKADLEKEQKTALETLTERDQRIEQAQKESSDKGVKVQQLTRNMEDLTQRKDAVIKDQRLVINRQKEQKERADQVKFDKSDGNIVQVIEGGSQAYINIGREDGLQEGIRFGIYGKNSEGFTNSLPKASLEVLRILGEHRALGRVTDIDNANLTVPNDDLFNPVWERGRKMGVAIIGLVDFDNDGRYDNEELMKLIEQQGGRIDAYIDFKTYKPVGRITIDTAWLIEGKIPEATDAEKFETEEHKQLRKAIQGALTKFREDARDSSTRRVSVENFVNFMGFPIERRTQAAGEEDLVRKTRQKLRTKRLVPLQGEGEEADVDARGIREATKKKAADAKDAKDAKKGDEGDPTPKSSKGKKKRSEEEE